ncbi:uncharacterized protein CTRU02_212942 [Colletotrichum truncatum]|uniref:Uncharacterized protein n=1 Tax=Colletotrichum truncatum TaxID=5467 RepID=A0ACC3YJB3_COLTU|nr:uncharacterized protein CTRU02_03265 [Colletotrichum truncatum]KAF6797234.1 hypothetical protein CTRU02_03265 [Colletotrichum truncatum]
MVSSAMFRLATTPARHARPLVAGAVPRVLAAFAPIPPASAATSRRTIKMKPRVKSTPNLRPDPDAKHKRKETMTKIVLTKRALSEFRTRHRELQIQHVTAEEAYNIYSKYLDALANSKKSPYWEAQFLYDTNATAAALHETAIFVCTFPNMVQEEWYLYCNLLNSAAGMGYDASALSLARILLKSKVSKNSPFSYYNPAWAKMRERCSALIKAGRDANAIVVEGLIHLYRKTRDDDHLAIEAFKRAEEVGSDATHFDWFGTCLEQMGETQLRLGQKKEATKTFTRLAGEDYAKGYYHLALLKPESEHYLYWLTKAAVSGIQSAFEPLMNEHLRLSELYEDEGQKKLAERHRNDALEWGRLHKEWLSLRSRST